MQQILSGPDKYAGSYEQIGKVIETYCTFAPLELQRYFETIVFNFAIGNGDAHRKNFSLLTSEKGIVALSPAYDLVSSRLAIPEEDGETALTISGKKDCINKNDLMRLAHTIGVDANYAEKKIRELLELRSDLVNMIKESQLSSGLQQQLTVIINKRLDRLA